MAWVKLDDQFIYNPKVILAGKDARALYITALCYVGGQLTDGKIKLGLLPVLGALAEVDTTECAAKLVEVGLWDIMEQGYQIHDYLAYNPSRKDVRQRREEGAKRQATWRAKHRDDDGRYTSDTDIPTDPPTDLSSDAVTTTETNTVSDTTPSPSPSPSPLPVPIPILKEREVGVFAPTAAKPPPPKPRKPRDSRWRHPAVSCIKKVLDTKRNPPKAILDDLIAVLGDRPDAEKLLSCRKAWVARGYNNNSWAWALEWYRDGIPGWAARKGTSKRNGDGMANLSPEREAEYDRITEMHIAGMEGGTP